MERTSIASNRLEGARLIPPPNVTHRDTELGEILTVLEDKVENREVAEKAKR